MGVVMKEAGKAFVGGGSEEKQSVMNGAAMTLTKLVAQKQLSAFTGGSNSGGLGMLEVGKTVSVTITFLCLSSRWNARTSCSRADLGDMKSSDTTTVYTNFSESELIW